jgi:3-methyl-2-oxobutanoate hydroxymethyltransferase
MLTRNAAETVLREMSVNSRKALTMHRIEEMRRAGEKIAMLTCYDAAFARMLNDAGVDILLVGDSLGMVIQGHLTTLPVSVEDMVYHTRCVADGNASAWIIADMPFGSYQESVEQAIRNATQLMQAGANMIKLEGGGWTTITIQRLVERGIPVCAHLGLTPQSVHALGGYRIQGRDEETAKAIRAHAKELVDVGAGMLILELVPSALARELTASLPIPVIGIGAGVGCSGQVLVLHDMLGITRGKQPRFVRNFSLAGPGVESAVRLFVSEVKSGNFPDDAIHGY